MPLAWYGPILWPRLRNLLWFVAAGLAFSVSIELLQLAITLGLGYAHATDIDDVIVNAGGAPARLRRPVAAPTQDGRTCAYAPAGIADLGSCSSTEPGPPWVYGLAGIRSNVRIADPGAAPSGRGISHRRYIELTDPSGTPPAGLRPAYAPTAMPDPSRRRANRPPDGDRHNDERAAALRSAARSIWGECALGLRLARRPSRPGARPG